MDRRTLHAEAVAALRREVPDALDWLPLTELPALRWRSDGEPVDGRVPRGWVVLAAERGKPGPSDAQRAAAALFRPDDAAALALWLVRQWIAHDTAAVPLTDARRVELRGIAERAASLAARLGRGGTDPEARYRQLLAQESNRAAPDAMPHQGLLAIVATCGGDEVATEVAAFLDAHHAERAPSCRALIRMLGWVGGQAAQNVLQGATNLPALRADAEAALGARASRT